MTMFCIRKEGVRIGGVQNKVRFSLLVVFVVYSS